MLGNSGHSVSTSEEGKFLPVIMLSLQTWSLQLQVLGPKTDAGDVSRFLLRDVKLAQPEIVRTI